MAKSVDAESASADAIPPQWNADKEQRERVFARPIEDFGSIGAIFGIIASQFTKTPLTSAMNAAAAAMNATRDHDEEGYKTAYQAWKDNTALALEALRLGARFVRGCKQADRHRHSAMEGQAAPDRGAVRQQESSSPCLTPGCRPAKSLHYMDKYAGAADKMAKAAQDQEIIEERRQALTGLWQEQAQNNPQLFGQQGPDGKYSKPAKSVQSVSGAKRLDAGLSV